MGKDSKKNIPKAQPTMTKRQFTRFEKERRLQRIALVASAFVVALIVLIPGFGLWKEAHRGDEPAAKVAGKVITNETYAKVVGFRQAEIDATIRNYEQYLNTPPTPGQDQEGQDFLKQLMTQQIQSLQQQRGSVEMTALDDLIDNELIRREAARRGIGVTSEEVDNYVLVRFTPPRETATNDGSSVDNTPTAETPTPTPEATITPGPTSTPEPTPTPNPESVAKAKENLNKSLTSLGLLTETEYRTLIAEPDILRDKLQRAMGDEVPTVAEQVHVRHILFEKEEEAKEALAKLQSGADFEAMAKELSKDTVSKEDGGDLGWFPRGVMVPEFEKAAFEVKPGEIYPNVVQSSHGYHVIKGEGHESERQIGEEHLPTLKQKAFYDWLDKERSDSTLVEYSFGWETMKWARGYIASHSKAIKR